MGRVVVERDEYGEVTDTGFVELTTAEKEAALEAAADGKVHAATNGIFNNEEAAAKYAAQHTTADDAPQYVAYFPEADNAISELLIAGYQHYMEGDTLGLTNATKKVKTLMKRYGKTGLHLDGHSRGGITTGNAIESLNNEAGNRGSARETSVHLFGSAYNAQEMANELYTLSGDSPGADARVRQSTHKADFVGTLIGGNEATGGRIPDGSSRTRERLKIPFADDTVHSSYATRQGFENSKDEKRMAIKNYWGREYSPLLPVLPTISKGGSK